MTNETQNAPLRDWSDYDRVGNIISYECGDLDDESAVTLFQHLVDTGLAWTLQGHYGRTATTLIENGLVASDRFEYPTVTIDDLE